MQNIMEPIFEIAYLIVIITLGVLILLKAKGRRQFQLFGIMAILLGLGDAFHLVPRIYALWTDGLSNHVAALGFGTMVTSITMTVFYVLLYHVWCIHYEKKSNPKLTLLIYSLAAVRIALCLLPQNRWLSPDAPFSWGIYRNIPFALLGIIMIVLFSQNASGKGDCFRWMWLAITLSFMFYLAVVLFADAIPAMGMMMIPKTCAYVWIVAMGYRDVKKL